MESASRQCPIAVNRYFHTKEEALAAWNTRAAAPQPASDVPQDVVALEALKPFAEVWMEIEKDEYPDRYHVVDVRDRYFLTAGDFRRAALAANPAPATSTDAPAESAEPAITSRDLMRRCGADPDAPFDGIPPLTFAYTNWRGETAMRTVQPTDISYAAAAWQAEAREEGRREGAVAEREACIQLASEYCWMRYKGRPPANLHSSCVFTSHEWQKIAEAIRAEREKADPLQDTALAEARAEIARLREALEPFAEAANYFEHIWPDMAQTDGMPVCGALVLGQLRVARAVLSHTEPKPQPQERWARDMSDEELIEALDAAEKRFDSRGEHGGSPGESAWERMNEIETEQARRRSEPKP